MSTDKNPIDKLFEKGLENHQMKPSQGLWDKIEEGIEGSNSGRKGFYILRAAVVTLLIGLSALLYYQVDSEKEITPYNGEGLTGSFNHQLQDVTGEETEPKKEAAKKENEKTEKPTDKKATTPKKKALPLINTPKKSSEKIYVSNEKLSTTDVKEIAYEEELESMDEVELFEQEEEVKSSPKIRVKVKLRPKNTVESFYAQNEEPTEENIKDDRDLKDRVFAYAGNQVENILNGKPVELPKTKEEPKLELNWNKLFKD